MSFPKRLFLQGLNCYCYWIYRYNEQKNQHKNIKNKEVELVSVYIATPLLIFIVGYINKT